MQNYVYVLGCSTGRLTYVGWTTDLARRLGEHNAGTGARTTRGRVWTLLYAERFDSPRDAMRREWRLKRDKRFRAQLRALAAPDGAQKHGLKRCEKHRRKPAQSPAQDPTRKER